jgi:uncharacterized membrane protein YphA (DoxX/SURF4 family)
MKYNTLLFALGAILLGGTGIYFHDFALQWQPVPADIPQRTPLAYANGLLLLFVGAALLWRRGERAAALVLAVFYGLWVLVLHLPVAVRSPWHIGTWNSPAESLFMSMGALALWSASAGAMRSTLGRVARIGAGICPIVFGFAHFNYVDFTASFVPAWIPYKEFWAVATGAGHLAAGLALVSGIQARLAATLLTGMMGSFVVLMHLARVVAAPEQHMEWIMLGMSTSMTGAAWLIRKYTT